MEFFDTVKQVNKNWTPYKKWELEQCKKEKQNEQLREKYPPAPDEIEHAKQYGRTIVDVINIMDQHSIDKSEDASFMVKSAVAGMSLVPDAIIATGLGMIVGCSPKLKAKIKMPPFFIGGLTFLVAHSLTSAVGEVWGAQIEKQASRIARFQTRRDDLKNPRNFVVYSQEQIDKAKEIAKTLPEVEEKKKEVTLKKSLNPVKSFKIAKKTTNELRKDNVNYEEWKKEHLKKETQKLEKNKNMVVSSDEISKAEKDRDNILNTIRKIENSSLNYLMNMKLAITTLSILVSGLSVGAGLVGFKLVENLQKKQIIKRNANSAGVGKFSAMNLLPIFGIFLIAPIIKLFKDAARIGRFKAKQELLSKPENFITYDDEQRKSTGTIQEPTIESKGFMAKFKQDFMAIKQLKKDYEEYHNYMKTQRKEELKLDKALEQIEITDKQMADAKKLQKNAFNSFEKMDEKAQRFTDDADAAVDVSRKAIITPIAIAAKILTFSYYAKIAVKYGHPLKNPIDMITVLKYFKTKDFLKILGIGFIPSLIDLPLVIQGIQIKKESGKIGVMDAMKDLDDPKNFIAEDNLKKV